MEDYLIETPSIDYMDFHIQERVRELRNQSDDDLDYFIEVLKQVYNQKKE